MKNAAMTKRTSVNKKAKEIVRKKKKKDLEQSMNETISFVIKGKLTPLKPMENAKFKRLRKKIPPKLQEHKIKYIKQKKKVCRIRKQQKESPNQDEKKQTRSGKSGPKVETAGKSEEKDLPSLKAQNPKRKSSKPTESSKTIASQKKQKVKDQKGDEESSKSENPGLPEKKTNNKPTIKKECKKILVTAKTFGTNTSSKTTPNKKISKPKEKSKPDQKIAPKKKTPVSVSSPKESQPTTDLTPKNDEPPKIKIEPVEETPTIPTENIEEKQIEKETDNISIEEAPTIKEEPKHDDESIPLSVTDDERKTPSPKPKKKAPTKSSNKSKLSPKDEQKKKMKLFSLWNGPKRHRVASLNALAKVHCLYENESRGNFIDNIPPIKREPSDRRERSKPKARERRDSSEDPPPTRTLRTAPGLRGVGKHWDMHDTMSSSSSEDSYESANESVIEKMKDEPVSKPEEKKAPVKRRKRNEVIMDLKDMVVRKRMASLNASAILAASYSLEKNSSRSPLNSSDSDTESDSYSDDYDIPRRPDEDAKKDNSDKVIEVRATPSNKKVAVIVNQDTDVTITGVYVNSTTRSTHHEGYCSIAGMQYRISATSHTQTAATAVATETLLQSASSSSQENSNGESTPSKSYTPLDALSNMQPPTGTTGQHSVPIGHHHLGPPHISPQLSPLPRRHGCSSAFSAPPGHYPATGHHHHHPQTQLHPEQGYVHGYYQPAGPLINVPHHAHTQPQSLGKTAPLSEPSPSITPPPTQHPPTTGSAGDSSDNDVIITSVITKDSSPPQQQPTYRVAQYPPPPTHSYPYAYPYYPAPPPPHPAATYTHHDLCYPSAAAYLHKYPYRRYMPPSTSSPYFPAGPADLYATPPPVQQTVSSQSSQQLQKLHHQHLSCNLCPQVVTASQSAAVATSGSSGGTTGYQPPPSGPPPAPPTILDTYPPPPTQPPPTLVESYPPPPHYYPGYAPPPPCYSHPPARTLPYGAYQSCPCPMNTCPKNVHTGPLIGSSKRSDITSLTKDKVLLPVALALPLEPASATGPPSPARGSAGMPAPTSPAVAGTYQAPPTPKQEAIEPESKVCTEKRRTARVGKMAVRNNLQQTSTMLLMCQERDQNQSLLLGEVKREVESPKEDPKKVLIEVIEAPIKAVINSKVEPPQSPCENIEECPRTEIKLGHCDEVIEEITPQLSKSGEKQTNENPETIKIEEMLPTVPEKNLLEPCVKTVAENVKVKNMKRRSSSTKTDEPPQSPPKKRKIDPKLNGSYKDLINKNYNTLQISNGKRKLLAANQESSETNKLEPKRTRSTSKEIDAKKHTKLAKQSSNDDSELIENTEPSPNHQLKRKKFCSRNLKNIKGNGTEKNYPKSNVDRTIDCVVNESRTKVLSDTQRTNGEKVTNNGVKAKCEIKKEPVMRKKLVKTIPKPAAPVEVKKPPIVVKKKIKQKVPEVIVTAAPIVKPRRSLPAPKWSNGWTWMGEPYEGKVFLNSDEANISRKCYPAMRHEEGDIIEPRDCVLLKAGQKKNDLPFVAKVAALWENPEDGEMMFSLLWYYRPEHTDQGRLLSDEIDEVFASRHKDSNSVACIEDKCYVLTFNEYCRYRKNLRRLEHGLEEIPSTIPTNEPYPRIIRQPPANVVTAPDLVFFCRRVYDFRQKRIVKNPS
ncbi:bromodomain-containing protein 4 isoform X1 [Onthophagus taurus]|uniref:bromodomain-containing protein 4 isoform X1 n=1 Tax=Onthophagus taurus TaxID=166361 RepID=UPI0039BEC278